MSDPVTTKNVLTVEHVLGVAATPLAGFLLALGQAFPAQQSILAAAAGLVQGAGAMLLAYAPSLKQPATPPTT
jgi:hypothetical protein